MVSKGNVLLVDDEINLCRIVGAKLARRGFRVTTVHDGACAVEQVRARKYDVVILDLVLPNVDGITALAEIRCVAPDLPVIVMTACESLDVFDRAKKYSISAYVSKPFDLDWLVSLVEQAARSADAVSEVALSNDTVLFSRGQLVSVELRDNAYSDSFSGVVDAIDSNSLTIIASEDIDNALCVPDVGSCIKIGAGVKDAYYTFSSHVLRASKAVPAKVVVEKPAFIYRVQRRQHDRLSIRLPIRYCLSGSDSGTEVAHLRQGETVDISLGGICMVTYEDLEPGLLLRLDVHWVQADTHIGALARVLRATALEKPGQWGWLVGCQFVVVDSSLNRLLDEQTLQTAAS
ncbi:MAG: response regulator [Armatimonadota bacterium]